MSEMVAADSGEDATASVEKARGASWKGNAIRWLVRESGMDVGGDDSVSERELDDIDGGAEASVVV